MHLEFSGDVSRETSAASGRLFHGLGDEIPNNLREEDDQDDDGDGSGDRTAVLRKAMGAQVVAHDVEGASHQAENSPAGPPPTMMTSNVFDIKILPKRME